MVKHNSNKKGVAVQAIFFFFMSVIFIYMIIFGFQKIFLVQEELSEEDRRELIKEVEKIFQACDDPLNSGTRQYAKYDENKISKICIVENKTTFDSHGDLDDNIKDLTIEGASNGFILRKVREKEEIIGTFFIMEPKENKCYGEEGEIELRC